jgi:hypothetical protein
MVNQALVSLDLKVTRNTRLILYIYISISTKKTCSAELQDVRLERHSNVTRLNRSLQPSPPPPGDYRILIRYVLTKIRKSCIIYMLYELTHNCYCYRYSNNYNNYNNGPDLYQSRVKLKNVEY